MSGPDLWRWQFALPDSDCLVTLESTTVHFSEVPFWLDDDHTAAFTAFRLSYSMLMRQSDDDPRIVAICDAAEAIGVSPSRDSARQFFETNFSACHVHKPQSGALLTGYYEPEVAGARTLDPIFHVPVYSIPDDLVMLTEAMDRTCLPPDLTAARWDGGLLAPYFTRQEIEQGALNARGLELAYLADPIEAFVMQVQGSGLIRMPDGSALRVGFSAKNGHPYTSLGKALIDRGELVPDAASLDAVLAWLRADAERGQRLMWENKSYPFFRALEDGEAHDGPYGSLGAPLTPGRSLAVDPRYHRMGLPIWVEAADLRDRDDKPFNRLMIAQDSGSAIRGPVRGDIFWGRGPAAGHIAGRTKHNCDFYLLIPN